MINEIKDGNNLIRVETKDYKGITYIDVRKYFQLKNSTEWIPTKKGITLGLNNLSEVITLLEQAEASIKGQKP